MKTKILVLLCAALMFSCKKSDVASQTDIQENAQQVGDTMASVDEAGGSSGNVASMQNSIQKTFERYAPNDSINQSVVASLFLPKAEAVSCAGYGFGTCGATTANTIVRNFSNCTVGSAVLSGDVTLTWSGSGASSCQITGAGSSVARSPNFTLTGRRGATLAVTKAGTVGQSLTYVSGSAGNRVFSFQNDGIKRKFTLPNATVLFDQTTSVTSPITVTGSDRVNRVMNGGNLRVTNNVSSVTCNYVPTNVTWATGCNCPTSGSWAGSCSDGKATTLVITGCGTATYSEGSDTESVSFDRCGS